MAEYLYSEDEIEDNDDIEYDENDDEDEEYDTEYYRSAKWDPVLGDFVRDKANRIMECDGREAFMIWCLKMIVTQRDSHLAYIEEVTGNDLGVDTDEALRQVDRVSVEAYLEETIREALEINPKTEWVSGFTHEWDGDDIHTTFQVKGIDWDDVITIST